MVSNEELRRALRLCVEQMCARCREAADAMTSSIPCLEGCETLKIAKAALATDGEGETPVKNCANDNKTLSDIVAEIRQAVESMGDDLPYTISAGTVRRIADRIEAVAKRDAAIHAMTVEANERLREHLEIAIENDKRTAVGNAEAMREAVGNALWCLNWMDENTSDKPTKDHLAKPIELLTAALAAPPRNCDVMSLAVARKVWYVKEVLPRLIGDLPLDKGIPFEEWFVAPAAERKGDNDEQK